MIKNEEIKKLATQFREAIELVVEKKYYGNLRIFSSFPRGCCTYTSALLATYLIENGINVCLIKTLCFNSIEISHSWLLIGNDIYLDITADQFIDNSYFEGYKDIPKCVFVNKGEYIYKKFNEREIQIDEKSGIYAYSGEISIQLTKMYNAILQEIK